MKQELEYVKREIDDIISRGETLGFLPFSDHERLDELEKECQRLQGNPVTLT